MPTQSLPVHEGLPVDEKFLKSKKPPHRISVFKELDEVPPVWGREPQSGYKGRRILTPCSDGGKEYSIDGAAGVYEGLEVVELGRQTMPADYGYEMPGRYGGKQVTYGDEFAIPLAGNNNTWVPPSELPKRICGFGQRVFWITCGIVCLTVILGAVAAGIASSASKSSSTRVKTSSTGAIAISTALMPSTQNLITSQTSTMTLLNGSVILTTEIITSLQTITPHSTSKSQAPLSSPAMTVSAGSSPTTTPLATLDPTSPALQAATSNGSSQQLSPSQVTATVSTTTPTATLSALSYSSSPQVL